MVGLANAAGCGIQLACFIFKGNFSLNISSPTNIITIGSFKKNSKSTLINCLFLFLHPPQTTSERYGLIAFIFKDI